MHGKICAIYAAYALVESGLSYSLTMETSYAKIRYMDVFFSKGYLQALVSLIINLKETENN